MSREFLRRSHPGTSIGRFFGDLLTEYEVADLLRVRPSTVKNWRKKALRRGPSFIKIEHRFVRYRLRDIESYLKRRTVRRRGA